MNKPWYRCMTCDKLKFKSKQTYTIIMSGNGYEKTAYMCPPCGQEIDRLHKEVSKNDSDENEGPIDL